MSKAPLNIAPHIFGISGFPEFADIMQGSLGNCYFLAALAAIAYRNPEVISSMFIRRDLWNAARPVFVTQWQLDGRTISVAVDDEVPQSQTHPHAFFVQHKPEGGLW